MFSQIEFSLYCLCQKKLFRIISFFFIQACLQSFGLQYSKNGICNPINFVYSTIEPIVPEPSPVEKLGVNRGTLSKFSRNYHFNSSPINKV